MKIDRITFSCNEKDEYKRFWNPLSKYLHKKFGLKSALLFVGKDKNGLSEKYGDVHHIYCGYHIPTYIPAIWGYFYVTSFYSEEVCMTSGIDMPITNLDYFNNKIKNFHKEFSYVVMNATGYSTIENVLAGKNTVPSYYHVAKGKLFKQILNFEDDFKAEINKFNSLDYSSKYNGYSHNPASFLSEASVNNGGKWCLDEMYSSDMIISHHKNTNHVKLLSMDDCNNYYYHFHKPYPNENKIYEFLSV